MYSCFRPKVRPQAPQSGPQEHPSEESPVTHDSRYQNLNINDQPTNNSQNGLNGTISSLSKRSSGNLSLRHVKHFNPFSTTDNDSQIAFNYAIRSLVRLSTAFIKKPEVTKKITLDSDQVRRMKEAFRLFDKNDDGHITAKEICGVMRAIGLDIKSNEAKNLINNIDGNGNGKVEMREFIKFVSIQSGEADEDTELLMAFNIFDRDKNGKISFTEMQQILERLGENFTPDELQELFSDVDVDGDGEIDYEEFRAALKLN